MRDPDNLHRFYEYSDEAPEVIKITDLPEFDIPDYDLNDEKEFKKYLYDIERTVRNSFEYKRWLKYLREYVDMNKCSFYENVTNVDTTKIRIEVHHEPLSLFDIVLTVYNKRVAYRESLEVEMVAKEVMYHHFAMNIGVIPLAETPHELVHNQYLFVPSTRVFGNYKKFVQEYRAFMPQETLDVLQRIEEYTLAYDGDEYKQLLGKKFVYVDATGAYDLPPLEDVARFVKNHLRGVLTQELQATRDPEPQQPHCPIIFKN